ncbi:MAG: hypothetical protein RL230_2388 [Pseudomonadota bacterium]
MVICRKANVRTDEGTGEFSDKLFKSIACITKTGLTEVTIETGLMTGGVRGLVGKGCPILAAIAKGLAKGHLDVVRCFGIEGPIATMAKGEGDAGEERSPAGLSLADCDWRAWNRQCFRRAIEGFRQTFDLLGIEDRVAAQDTPGLASFFANIRRKPPAMV